MAVVVEALDGGLFDRPVHPFYLAGARRMVGFGQPVLDPVRLADHVEAHRPRGDGVPVPGLFGELDAVVGQDCMDLVGHGFEHVLQELPGRLSVGRCNDLGNRELGCPVNADEQGELSLIRLHFDDVDVKEADGVAFELLPLGLVALHIRQA